MSNLLNIKEVRNRMLNCKPSAGVLVAYGEDDAVQLMWLDKETGCLLYKIEVFIEQVRANCRVFEREMHKAKRAMRKL